jgi:nicotinamide mononucleotide transporter
LNIESSIVAIEYLALITGIIGVWLTTKENIWCWIVSIFSVSLYVLVFFYQKLYADSALQFLYIGMSFYGWYVWKNPPKNKAELPITRLLLKDVIISIVVFVTLSYSISYYLKTFTDSPVPYLDAIFTSSSIVCTWLMAKKVLENWLIWIVIDIGYVGLFIYRELYPTSILYLVFIFLAWKGFVDWKKTHNLQRNA